MHVCVNLGLFGTTVLKGLKRTSNEVLDKNPITPLFNCVRLGSICAILQPSSCRCDLHCVKRCKATLYCEFIKPHKTSVASSRSKLHNFVNGRTVFMTMTPAISISDFNSESFACVLLEFVPDRLFFLHTASEWQRISFTLQKK